MLERIINALKAQQTDKRVEWLALDSGSTDATLDTLRNAGFRVLEVAQDTFDWGRIRERLYAAAQGDIIVNLSQDAVPAHGHWLENLIAPLTDPAVGASCGSSIPDPERDTAQFPWERNGYFYFTREIGKFVARYGKGLSFANSAVPKSVWERLHFDAQATGEDFQFQMKLHDTGLRIAFPENAPVLHHHNYSFRGLFRRCRNEGLALREMGCPYTEWDYLRDLISTPKYLQWLRELKRGSLTSPGAAAFPLLRPTAVYLGSRFAKKYVWY